MILLALLNSLLPAAAIAVIAWVVLRISRVNAATRYWAWWAVATAIVALFFWPSPPIEGEVGAPVEVQPATNPFARIALLWMAFALYRLIRIAISYIRLRGIVNGARVENNTRLNALRDACGVKRNARLLISNRIDSPIAAGFLHAAVILPERMLTNLTSEELDHVLLHELAHIARRDDWTNLAARIAGALLSIHPVIAFVLARIDKERELACDDWVVAATGEARPYAASLARIFELSRGHEAQPLASGITGSRLGDRIEQLLAQGRRFTRDASIVALIFMATALGTMVLVGTQSPAWVAFAQERAVPPLPPVAPVAPAAPVPPVPPVAPVAPPAPAAPSPLLFTPIPHAGTPPSPGPVDLDRQRARLHAFEAEMRARQAQMTQAERQEQDTWLARRESLRSQEEALKAELQAVLKELEEVRRENQR